MGRGVFAGSPYRRGEVIEVCPVIRLPAGPPADGLEHYVFKWGVAGDELAVALGYGSLYNHSPTPNATFATRLARGEVVLRAARDVTEGEQIVIDYQWDEEDYVAFARPGASSRPITPGRGPAGSAARGRTGYRGTGNSSL
jgi:SET domain-containing protein